MKKNIFLGFTLGVLIMVSYEAYAQIAQGTSTPLSQNVVDDKSYIGKLLLSATTTPSGVSYNYYNKELDMLKNIDDKLGVIIQILNKK